MVLQVLDQVHRGLEVDDWTFKKTFVFDMSIPLRVKNRIKHGWRHLVRTSVWKPHDYRIELLDFSMDHVLTP